MKNILAISALALVTALSPVAASAASPEECYGYATRLQILMKQGGMKGTQAYQFIQSIAIDLKPKVISDSTVGAYYDRAGRMSVDDLIDAVAACGAKY